MSENPPTPENDDIEDLLEALDETGKSGAKATPEADEQESPKLARADLGILTGERKPAEEPAKPKGLFVAAEEKPSAESAQPPEPEPVPEIQAEPEPPPTMYRYRVSVVLQSALETQLNAARQSINLPVAMPGIFALQEDFHCQDEEQLKSLVKKWAQSHLPLKVTLERVEAAVIGEQRYVASWGLEPAERIQKAQKSLVDALAPHVEGVAQESLPFEARLVVADRTPAEQFPRLIHALQKRLQPQEWQIEAVEILRTEEDDDRWEVIEKIERA
jgi:hypothetical protein